MLRCARNILVAACAFAVGPAVAQFDGSWPDQPVEQTARELLARLDLSRPELATVKASADAGDLSGALNRWRDLVIDRLRQRDFGEYGWHGYKPHPRPVTLARYHLGRASDDELRQWHPKLVGSDGIAVRLYSGNFEEPLPSLVYCFWHERDPAYLRRGVELMAAFCATNQPEHWRRYRARLAGEPVSEEPPTAEWRINVNGLEPGWRLKNIMQVLAGYAKSLGDDRAADWGDVLRPVAGRLTAEQYALIPADQLAWIAISGYEHHAPWLLWFCLEPGAVPNQRSTGLRAATMLNLVFDDFAVAGELAEMLDRAYTELLTTNFLPDGGSLEQSFNYNREDTAGLEELARLFLPGEEPEWVRLLHQRVAARRLIDAGLATPLGGLPSVGNSHVVPGQPVWRSAELAERWWTLTGEGRSPVAPQEYLSIAYPYSGFYAMRDGWGMFDRYLFMMNGRPHTGHSMRDNLSIQVTAFGRQLLVTGGPPTYGNPANDDGKGADFYLSEASSLKTNTVMVDGKSQARTGPIATVAPQTPVASRFHTSDLFDLVDGRFSLGYEAPDPRDRQLDQAVDHERVVVFVRPAGLWLVLDRMHVADDTPRTFTQVWNFPPYVEDRDARKTAAGFTADQFVFDPTTKQFSTADPTGPNLAFWQTGPAALDYVAYTGDRERWLGWFARGIFDCIPATDVHVNWERAAGQTLLTWLSPRDVDQLDPIAAATSLGQPGAPGSALSLRDGGEVAVVTAPSPTRLSLAGCSAEATELLVYQRDGLLAGLVRGGDTVTLPGGAVGHCPADCFEFRLAGDRVVVTPVWLPQVPQIDPAPQPAVDLADHPPVTISAAPGLVARYTLDGSVPTATAPAYAAPLGLTGPTTVMAGYFRGDEPLPLTSQRDYQPWRWRLRTPDPLPEGGLEPGLRYRYAKRDRWSRLYDLTKDALFQPFETGLCTSLSQLPADRQAGGQSAMVFTGYLQVPVDGVYQFWVEAADGLDLWINDPSRELEVPPQVRCSYTTGRDTGFAALRAGYHRIQISYKKSRHSDLATVEVAAPGLARQPLPESWFHRAADEAAGRGH